ncbi:MAG: hypothetical protein ACLUO5_01820 [Ruminococcus sp.]
MYTNRWYKGYYLTANGTIATSQMVSENVYVNEEGRKCAKERGTSGKTEEETPVHRKWVQRQLVCVCGKSENRGYFVY